MERLGGKREVEEDVMDGFRPKSVKIFLECRGETRELQVKVVRLRGIGRGRSNLPLDKPEMGHEPRGRASR